MDAFLRGAMELPRMQDGRLAYLPALRVGKRRRCYVDLGGQGATKFEIRAPRWTRFRCGADTASTPPSLEEHVCAQTGCVLLTNSSDVASRKRALQVVTIPRRSSSTQPELRRSRTERRWRPCYLSHSFVKTSKIPLPSLARCMSTRLPITIRRKWPYKNRGREHRIRL